MLIDLTGSRDIMNYMFLKNRRFRRSWHFASLKKQHVKRVAVYMDVVQTDKTIGKYARSEEMLVFESWRVEAVTWRL